ncbi:MAG TPA: carbamoyltransferase C-terminal domain-containing protein [Planctomycetota bacterium]
MAIILGINAFHADSAACLVIDGELKAAVAEERLGRRLKHDPGFPVEAIRRVLADSGVRLRDVTHIAIARDPGANRLAKAMYILSRPIASLGAVVEHRRRSVRTTDTLEGLPALCGEDPEKVRAAIVPVEHHLAHIASAYYLSPFESATAALSYDASGDFASLMAARCEGTHIDILDRVFLPHSLGFFYTALCQFIGFDEFGEEYKVMGLASYGNDAHAGLMQELVRTRPDGWFRLNTAYFGMHQGGESGALDEGGHLKMGLLYTPRLVERLGRPRGRTEPVTQREMDIAKSCQVRFEEIATHCLIALHKRVRAPRLALAGGCALNGVMNARVSRETPFEQSYIQCAASDDGTCIGAAYYCWHAVLGQRRRFHMSHAYWGPEYPESRLRAVAEASGHPVRCYADQELLDAVVEHLLSGQIVGWYQGRSEWGPRALGNRSILANPCLPTMKDTINAKIKRRESFRPFAPTVLREFVGEYFEQDLDSPFMMHVVKIREAWRAKLPAVTHIDGTGRLQSLRREDNPKYYDLIEAFRRKTGVGVLLNTSFNENEPIVDTPEQAMDCFRRTEMDVLCLGNYVIRKLSK